MVRRIEKVQDACKLSNVVLTLAAKKDVAKFKPDNSALTVVMYRNLKIQASRRLAKPDDLNGEAVKAILADIPDKLLPKR